MPRRITIKQIAELAGVSSGTVDRVLHNRGKVASDKLERITAILEEIGYRANIHTSAVALKKSFKIVIFTPSVQEGDYWKSLYNGFDACLREYSDVDILDIRITYDQYDIKSFLDMAQDVLSLHPDGVIIGPTFSEGTIQFCRKLEEKGIPYAFVDSSIPDTNPVASFSANQQQCGRLLANMLGLISSNNREIAIINFKRSGAESFNSIRRMEAMKQAFLQHGMSDRLKYTEFSVQDTQFNNKVEEYLDANPLVESIAILNSRGSEIADVIKKCGKPGIHIGCFDLTAKNMACLKDGSISFILHQNPEKQAFEALRAMVAYLIFQRLTYEIEPTVKVEIVLKENCPG